MEETTTAITAVKQEVQLRDWAAQIAAQQASGMTVQKWCAENGINPKTYYYHLRQALRPHQRLALGRRWFSAAVQKT